MTLTLLFILSFAVAFFSPENLVTTFVGVIAATGITQWIKVQTGLVGVGALFLAIAISVAVAVVAVLVGVFFSGGAIGWDTLPNAAVQIFALATVAYKLIAGISDSVLR